MLRATKTSKQKFGLSCEINLFVIPFPTVMEATLLKTSIHTRLCLFNTYTLYLKIRSTLTVVAIYKVTAKTIEFVSGKSGLAILLYVIMARHGF